MKIILLSDLHLTFKNQLTNQGFDVNAQFIKILDHLKTLDIDHLIILGDICYQEGEFEIYDWFFDELDALGRPFDLISGNHDNPEMIIQILDQPTVHTYDKEIFYAKELGNRYCIFLDTSQYELKGQQLEWLKDKLYQNEKDLIIFMHHPPCNGKVAFMDSKYFLINRTEILRLFDSQDYKIDFFSGHYHVDKTLTYNNTSIHICPSPFFTINQKNIEFEIEHQKPCYQILELVDDDIKLESFYL